MAAMRDGAGSWESRFGSRGKPSEPRPEPGDAPWHCSDALIDRIESMHQTTVHRIEELHRDTWAAMNLRHQHIVGLLEQNHSDMWAVGQVRQDRIVSLLEQNHRDDWEDRRMLIGGGADPNVHGAHLEKLEKLEQRLKALERSLADGVTVTRSELQSFRLENANASDVRTQAILDRLPPVATVDSTSSQVRTWDIVKVLQEHNGAQAFLQLLTPTTSELMSGRAELRSFRSVATLTYASVMQQTNIGWSHRLPHLGDLVTWFDHNRIEADIVFVDPWHTYEDSITTLLMALDAVAFGGGYVVVHDCNPARLSQIGPVPPDMEDWCGETWRAFIDVGSSLPAEWRWWVVDTDLGVGVIEVPPRIGTDERAALVVHSVVPESGNSVDAWAWLEAHRGTDTKLVDFNSWLSDLGI